MFRRRQIKDVSEEMFYGHLHVQVSQFQPDSDLFLIVLLNFDAGAGEAFAHRDLPPSSVIGSALSRILNTPIVISL